MINDVGQNISDEIVQGPLYPSCLACVKGKKECQWKMSVITLRLQNLPSKPRNCENCVRSKANCQFIWDREESLKRPAESGVQPESSKRVKVDSSDLVTCLQNLDKQIGDLVKLTAAQAQRTTKDHHANLEMFETIQTSLEGLHEKYNDN